jgi:hypothetical protein
LLAIELSAFETFLLLMDFEAALILLATLVSAASVVKIFPLLSSNSTLPSALSSKK